MFLSIIKDLNSTFHSIISTKEIQDHDIFQISWKICVFFFVKLWDKILYMLTFQWLRDFAYLPISLPSLNEKLTILPSIPEKNPEISSFFSRSGENIFDWFSFSNHSWSLAFLSPEWFDSFIPNHFLSGPSSVENFKSLNLSHIISISIFISFSSFLNSFLINFPLSLSNILSLRYSITQSVRTGCVSVLGIVIGEIVFMLFLILPPPFIQITLVYLESVWPYILGISLIVFIIYDLINNPFIKSLPRETRGKSNSNWPKIFIFSFLLSFTEQSCLSL